MRVDVAAAQENYENYRFCYENGHDEWVKVARRCFDFYRNRQWEESDLQFLKAAGRPALTFNIIESLVRAMKGIQRAMRNDVRFTPFQDAGVEEAKVMDQLWLFAQSQNALDFVESEIWERGLIMGRAFYDVRMCYDESLQGSVIVKPLRSQDVILDPAIDSYHPDDWPQVTITRWVNLLDIEHKYGKDAADHLHYTELPNWYMYEDQLMASTLSKTPYFRYVGIPDQTLVRAYRLVDRQYRVNKMKEVFVDTTTGDTSEVPESWDRARISRVLELTPGLGVMKRKMKTIRWTTSVEDLILHDDDSPYNHFTTVPFFPTFIDGVTMGPVESLLDPQMLYNKVTSQELQIINTTANSGYKVKRGAVKNMTIEELERVGARPGFVVELDDINNLEKFQPNATPSGHDRISFKADKIMRDLAGMPQSARGYAREDVSGEAIMLNQAANDINWAAPLANLHRSKEILAKACLDLFQTYYTEERVIQVTHGSVYNPQVSTMTINQMTPEGQMVNDVTRGKYNTVLVPAPSRTTMNEGEFQQVLELKKLGVQIPDSVLIELSSMPNKQQILEQLQGDSSDAQRQEQQMQMELTQLQMQLMQAQIEDMHGRAELSSARANKANAEAQEQQTQEDSPVAVEHVRSASAERIAALNGRIKVLQEQMKGRAQAQKNAIELVKIDKDNETKKEIAKMKPKPAPAGAKKKPTGKRGK